MGVTMRHDATDEPPQSAPRRFVEDLLTDHGLPRGALERLQGWANQIWLAKTYVVRISSGRFVGSFAYEARALRALGHVPCPRVLATGDADGREWMIQTRLAGVSLLTAWPDLSEPDREAAIRSLAAALGAVHETPAGSDLAEPPWRAAALCPGGDVSMAYRAPPTACSRLIEANLRAQTAPESLLHDAGRFIDSRLGLFALDTPVLTHGDVSFANVLWDGKQAALVDFESAGLGPLDRELDLLLRFLSAPGEFSPGAASAAPMFTPVLGWLRDAYPELFGHPDLIARLEVYDALWELVQLLNYPPDHPRNTAARLGRILAGDAVWKAAIADLA